MRLATWNVNSVRARSERIVEFLKRSDIDVLAMQETKVADAKFPTERFTDLGYEIAHTGLDQWNGVAIASRVGLADVMIQFPGQPGFAEPAVAEARAISALCDDVRVWSLYIPNGRELSHPHYAYKLDWLAKLKEYAAGVLTDDSQARVALVGDWNVAPLDEDVWDPKLFVGHTHVSRPERDALSALTDAGFAEVTRAHTPGPGTFTYWDYTQLRFPKRQGMRIDLAYASPALARLVTGARIDRDERKGKGASDHAPVIVEFG